MNGTEQILEVWGPLACFTRPDMGKVERFSYPVITPSAARGIFDAIYCKPSRDGTRAEFRWQVTAVEVLSSPRYIALRRNEVKDKASVDSVLDCMAGKKGAVPIWADGDEESNFYGADMKGRTQRQTMALRDVRYRLHAVIRPWPGHEGSLEGLECQFKRRARHGKCVYQPYFGCREFAAYFEYIDDASLPAKRCTCDIEIGWMLYDVFDLSRPGTSESGPSISLFKAKVTEGILSVPPYESDEVRKGIKEVI